MIGDRTYGNERGLTLIEFTMAAALAGVMFMVLYSILNMALDSFQIGQLRSSAVQSGRVSMTRIVSDLRTASNIYIADTDRILIERPVETSSPLISASDRFTIEQIGYQYTAGSGSITRYQEDTGSSLFMEDVAGFSFVFRDAFYAEIAVPVVPVQRIRYIEVQIDLQEADYTITLRNLVVLDNPVIVP